MRQTNPIDDLLAEPPRVDRLPVRHKVGLPARSTAVAESIGSAKQSVRTSEWKYILHSATGQEELYHLPTDPDERDNLIGDRPGIASNLRTFLQDPDRIEQLESPNNPMVSPEDQEILRALGYIE